MDSTNFDYETIHFAGQIILIHTKSKSIRRAKMRRPSSPNLSFPEATGWLVGIPYPVVMYDYP
jgi:hypothetical protein